MNWSQLGKEVAQYAPEVGTLIGGPAGAAVGSLVAGVFGTKNDPDQIAQAIKNDPDAALKLQKLKQDHQEEMRSLALKAEGRRLDAEASMQENVNHTIQVGYKQGVLWRRAVGWSFAVVAALTVLGVFALAALAIYADEPGAMKVIPDVAGALSAIFYCYLAVLGVAGYQEGKLGRAMAGDKGGTLDKAIKAIRGD